MKSYIEKNKHKTNHHIPYAPGIVNPFFGRWFCGWNNMSRKKRLWPRQKCCDFNVGQIQQALRVSLSGPVSINQLLSALGGLWWEATWWLIPLSKWVITPVISGLTLLIPFITGVITHLLSGMSHQVVIFLEKWWITCLSVLGFYMFSLVLSLLGEFRPWVPRVSISKVSKAQHVEKQPRPMIFVMPTKKLPFGKLLQYLRDIFQKIFKRWRISS